MSVITNFFCYLLSLILAFPGIVFTGGDIINNYSFKIDASQVGEELPNVVSNVNVWEMGTQFINPTANEKYNIFEFVEYVQLMQCTGGNATRDLFEDPMNFDVLDDYKFDRLIDNCKGILTLGAKPHLKLGSVPLKYSSNAVKGADFDTNIYPPDDYNVYYDYIAAIAQALVDEFGAEEVLTWRFGVMTEYENEQWFKAPGGMSGETAVAYCKLYDYTVAALQEVIGEDVFVGAHSMTVTEGLWDEESFILHCGKGVNYKTGERGTRICFLAGSFYDSTPGEYTSGYDLPGTIKCLQSAAKDAGLEDLIFGIDEGKILCGNTSGEISDQLNTRTVGYTYQAAYDARLYKQLFDTNGDYFSAWGYLSNGLLDGYPTVSYHVADYISDFAGSKRVLVEKQDEGLIYNGEVEAVSAYDESTGTLRIMAYNFKNKVNYKKDVDLSFEINAPQFNGKNVKVTAYVVDDDANFFDEWVEDRKTYGIGNDCFDWSPEDPQIESYVTLNDQWARDIYFTQLRDKYEQCAQLEPKSETVTVNNSTITLSSDLAPNGVLFYEITQA
ncbi:MAG: hypothetical protein IJZ57_07565 [Clostridia bacterium]|nr:hypothetical protein [Clostridia bacterium]